MPLPKSCHTWGYNKWWSYPVDQPKTADRSSDRSNDLSSSDQSSYRVINQKGLDAAKSSLQPPWGCQRGLEAFWRPPAPFGAQRRGDSCMQLSPLLCPWGGSALLPGANLPRGGACCQAGCLAANGHNDSLAVN